MKIEIKQGGLSIPEALALIRGELLLQELSDKQRETIREDGQKITEIYLEKNAVYDIQGTLFLTENISIYGNNARINCQGIPGVLVAGSHVLLRELTVSGSQIAVRIDSMGSEINDILFENCCVLDYAVCGLCAGSSVSSGVCSNVTLHNCEFRSADRPENAERHFPTAQDIILCAASAGNDVKDAVLNGVKIAEGRLLGASVCNIFIVPGLWAKTGNVPTFDNCTISDILVENCILHGSFDTSLAAQANYINNNNCRVENVAVKNNDIEVGITGVSATAGSPMLGSCDGIYFKNFVCTGNHIKGYPGAGEPRAAICIDGGLINYYSNVQCRNSWVEDVNICRNDICEIERGIMIKGAFSMIDAEKDGQLAGNYVKDVAIRENMLRDVETCFLFYGAWIEGRRYDWNWGRNHTEQIWLEHPVDNSISTMSVEGNYIRNLCCEKNRCNGFRYLLKAAGAAGRGHGNMKDNRVQDNIVFRDNIIEGGENHIHVADCIMEDWVNDLGGNCVNSNLKNI